MVGPATRSTQWISGHVHEASSYLEGLAMKLDARERTACAAPDGGSLSGASWREATALRDRALAAVGALGVPKLAFDRGAAGLQARNLERGARAERGAAEVFALGVELPRTCAALLRLGAALLVLGAYLATQVAAFTYLVVRIVQTPNPAQGQAQAPSHGRTAQQSPLSERPCRPQVPQRGASAAGMPASPAGWHVPSTEGASRPRSSGFCHARAGDVPAEATQGSKRGAPPSRAALPRDFVCQLIGKTAPGALDSALEAAANSPSTWILLDAQHRRLERAISTQAIAQQSYFYCGLSRNEVLPMLRDVLGPGETMASFSRAYRQRALRIHPDKTAHMGKPARRLATLCFQISRSAHELATQTF